MRNDGGKRKIGDDDSDGFCEAVQRETDRLRHTCAFGSAMRHDPYVAVSRGIIMICHEDYAFSKLAFLALIAFAGYLGRCGLELFLQ